MASQSTKSRIIESAGPIFAEHGFESATVREICDAAGANLASVNYHFGDKETLYVETIKYAHELRMRQVPMLEVPDGLSAEAGLRMFVATMLERMLKAEEAPWQARLMMRELIAPTGACRALVESFIRPTVSQLLAILQPLLPADCPVHLQYKIGFSVIGQCLHYKAASPIVEMLIPAEDLRANFEVDHLTDHITRFTLAALHSLRTHPEGCGTESGSAESQTVVPHNTQIL